MGIRIDAGPPEEARHVHVGTPILSGCLTSVVPTGRGIRFAGKDPYSATGRYDDDNGWTFESVEWPQPNAGTSALVFGDANAQVVAWPSTAEDGIHFDFFDAEGGLVEYYPTSRVGEPVAAVGSSEAFSLVFSEHGSLSVLEFRDGEERALEVESAPCLTSGSVAIGTSDGETVVGYTCGGLFAARVDVTRGLVERTEFRVEGGDPTTNELLGNGVPAVFWHDGEFLFAHLTAAGAMALTRVTPGDPTPHTQLVTGMPPITLNRDQNNPTFSVVQLGDQIGLTRAACNRHEDARSTGTFDLCRVSAENSEAVCSQVEAPCQEAKLVSDGMDVMLLACRNRESPALVPLDLAAIPAEQPALFPTGHSHFTPLALSCEGASCSALVEINSSPAATGYDFRLAFVDLEFGEGCVGSTCGARPLEPTSVLGAWSDTPSFRPSIGVERQSAGLPFAVVTLLHQPDGLNFDPRLSLLERDGVRWAGSVPTTAAALFARGGDFLGFWKDSFQLGVNEFTVNATGLLAGPTLPIRPGGSDLPSVARCGERFLVHGLTQPEGISPGAPTIASYNPGTGEFVTLFDPGVTPPDYNDVSFGLGCAGDRVLVLDGLEVREYSLSGERGPEVLLSTPPGETSGDRFYARLEARDDHALVLSAVSGRDVLDVIVFHADGTNRAFELPLPAGVAPVAALAVAPDRGDGWLRVLYQSGQETVYATGAGNVYASAYKLFD
jgi:hypothetical protein